MADPVEKLTTVLQDAIAEGFGKEFRDIDPIIRRSEHADYQANVAMSLAKQTNQSPREVAQKIADKTNAPDLIDSIELAGPGFLNISLTTSAVEAELRQTSASDSLGVNKTTQPERIVVEYSQPNVAKEMHVGHLRSTIIGDALARTFDFFGHTVIRQNHIGDWGTPYGMLIEHMLDLGQSEAAHELSVGDLDKFYKEARKKFDEDAGFAERSRERVVKLQAHDPETLELWQFLLEKSRSYFNRVYRQLDVLLQDEDIDGESMYNDDLPKIAQELENDGIAVIDEGALCVYPPGFTNREGKPAALIIRKKDGGYNYATTDLAAVRHRVRDLKVDRSYYVVDARQTTHFAMVFAVARMAGWLDDSKIWSHVPFGSVLGEDGKPYKTRSGETAKLIDLLDEAVARAAATMAERNPDITGEEATKTARAIGIGAVKYSDLANDRVKDYVFSFDRMLAFEGNTAPYLQYAHARIYSIFRRAGIETSQISASSIQITNDEERQLALQLLSFSATVTEMIEYLQPHRLCTYLFELASVYTTFYEKHSVLNADAEEIKNSRLAFSLLTARTLRTGLSLLGIETPERM